MCEQLAAENFLKGYKNGKIAYEVMNRCPRTLNEALSYVTTAEQNFKATFGWDLEKRELRMARRVNWADLHERCFETENPDNEDEQVKRVHAPTIRPTYVTVRLKKIENMLSNLNLSGSHRSSFICSPSPARKFEIIMIVLIVVKRVILPGNVQER